MQIQKFRRLFVYSMTLLSIVSCGRSSSKKPKANASEDIRRSATGYSSPADISGQVRRLSKVELDHTVIALLGHQEHLALLLPPDEEALGYTNGQQLSVAQLFLDQWQQFAGQIAAAVAKPGERLSRELDACLKSQGEESCVTQFISNFGKQAFRRPLGAEEVAGLQSVFNQGKAAENTLGGLKYLVETLITSPSFLYRTEHGSGSAAEGELYDLTPHELASALSYTLTSYPPDAELMAAADTGSLGSADVWRGQAERLLRSPEALNFWRHFIFEWLKMSEIDSINRQHPQFSASLPLALRRETEAFIEHIFTEGEGSLTDLLGAEFSYLNPELSALYGTPAQTGRVELNASERRGILTQGAFLAVHAQIGGSAPVRRGRVILERLFCEELPPPPPGVAMVPKDVSNGTTRDRFAAHAANPSCQACHVQMDPIGFAFENYDAIGKYRVTDNNLPVDASGQLPAYAAAPGPFDNALELIDRMAQSERVHQCVVRQMFRYSMGRREGSEDAAMVGAALGRAEAQKMDLRAALLDFVVSQQFKQRLKTGS